MASMMAETLDLTPLANAHQRLTEGLARYQHDTTDAQIRDGLIQRFEFTYELAHRTLKRYLESVSPTPGTVDAMPFAELIRTANEHGLLRSSWPTWKRYRDMRSKTSHTYNEDTAHEVVRDIPDFLEEAAFLVARLRERVAS